MSAKKIAKATKKVAAKQAKKEAKVAKAPAAAPAPAAEVRLGLLGEPAASARERLHWQHVVGMITSTAIGPGQKFVCS